MFGLSKKERAADALRLGAETSLNAVFSSTELAGLGLNRNASAYLQTDAIVHRLLMLSFLSADAFGSESWNTPTFFVDGIRPSITKSERGAGIAPNSLFQVLLNRYVELLSVDARFLDTASRVQRLDAAADPQKIERILGQKTDAFLRLISKYFAGFSV